MTGEDAGKLVTLGGRQFKIADLPLRRVKAVAAPMSRLLPRLGAGQLLPSAQDMDDMLFVIHQAMQQAGEQITVADLEELVIRLDELAVSFADVCRLVLPGGGDIAPKATPVAAGSGTGTQFMPTSSPQPDGPGSTSTTA